MLSNRLQGIENLKISAMEVFLQPRNDVAAGCSTAMEKPSRRPGVGGFEADGGTLSGLLAGRSSAWTLSLLIPSELGTAGCLKHSRRSVRVQEKINETRCKQKGEGTPRCNEFATNRLGKAGSNNANKNGQPTNRCQPP